MPKVNPKILVWARESARLSREEAAEELGLSGPDRLEALEEGARPPSRRQLLNMSAKYRRPLVTFYLSEPPKSKTLGQDFRTLPNPQTPESEALLNALLRNVYARQQLVRAALEEAEEDEPLGFVGSATIKEGVERVAASIREGIKLNLEDFRAQRNVSDAFGTLRAAVESAGVFVLLMGNLGTHHTDIDVQAFRGFALADAVAPFVVINEKDSRAAWSFTLLHELTHIWLGETGISGYGGGVDVERFCDAVAASLLLERDELNEIRTSRVMEFEELVQQINEFAGRRNLSRTMVAYNLFRSDRIAFDLYRKLTGRFDEERNAQKADNDDEEGGPNYYVVRRHRIGRALIGLVDRMLAAGVLSSTKAGKVLGVKPTAVDRLISGRRAA
jgi:Zn-dependent peptidase ImmA (M78 family)/transcriptional regulator with XRE-family HTH domain